MRPHQKWRKLNNQPATGNTANWRRWCVRVQNVFSLFFVFFFIIFTINMCAVRVMVGHTVKDRHIARNTNERIITMSTCRQNYLLFCANNTFWCLPLRITMALSCRSNTFGVSYTAITFQFICTICDGLTTIALLLHSYWFDAFFFSKCPLLRHQRKSLWPHWHSNRIESVYPHRGRIVFGGSELTRLLLAQCRRTIQFWYWNPTREKRFKTYGTIKILFIDDWSAECVAPHTRPCTTKHPIVANKPNTMCLVF